VGEEMNIAFFETNAEEEKYLRKTLKQHSLIFLKETLTEKNVVLAKQCDIVSVFVYSKITAAVIAALPQLRAIITRSTGFDHIDLDACRHREIGVYHIAHYGHTVAEHTLALILALSRNIIAGQDRVMRGIFSYQGLQGTDLRGKTIGIIGLGKIGKEVALIARAFGMHVIAHDIIHDKPFAQKHAISYCSLNALLERTDIVTLHCNQTKENRHLLNPTNLPLMKKNAFLINTARGGLVKTDAILQLLKHKKIQGVGLDVIEEEFAPPAQRKKVLRMLLNFPSVIITPHIAFNSKEALEQILHITCTIIQQSQKKLPMDNRVL